jgi:dipeptidyl aminopeptidase/acylaminoacyl peptidase
MTVQDLLAAIRVSDPQLSPDGRLVAFVRTTADLTSGKRNADIWVGVGRLTPGAPPEDRLSSAGEVGSHRDIGVSRRSEKSSHGRPVGETR